MADESDPAKAAKRPRALVAAEAAPRARQTNYPAPFAAVVAGRLKRPLGDPFGLRNFGVNHTRLAPGAASALRHAHSRQDELVYVLEGRPTLVTNDGPLELAPGMCVGFPAGTGDAHHIVNRTGADVVLLEIGDRSAGDEAEYPDDDIRLAGGQHGGWLFTRKDGTKYD